MYVRPDEPITLQKHDDNKDKTQCPAWAYIGSANLSESAWYPSLPFSLQLTNKPKITNGNKCRGRLVQDRTSTTKTSPKPPKLNCRNWECGVLVPVSAPVPQGDTEQPESKYNGESEGKAMLDIFNGTIPIPMTVPGRKYEGDDRLKPWYFMESRSFGSGFGGF